MSGSKKCPATTEALNPAALRCRLVREVAGHRVLEPQFLFLKAVEKVFVWVRPMLFLVDQRVKRGVLGFQSLDLSLVHRCHSFPQLSHDPVIKHETGDLSRAFDHPVGRRGGLSRSSGSDFAQVAVKPRR